MAQKKLKDLKILFVEDEDIIRKRTVSSLKYLVLEVVEASNGLEALQKIETFTPDLIITDLQMPFMSGIELIKKVRAKEQKLPIMVLTAHTSEKYLMQLIDMHIEKYIVKPITLEKLIEALEDFLNSSITYETIQKKLPFGYEYNWNQKLLMYENGLISITKKEILFLELLFKNLQNITTYEQLQRVVWQDSVMTDNALRSLVSGLRKKLPKDFIFNLSGVGYKLI